MKRLLDIQQDIRSLENNVQNMMECIQNINSDMNELRNSGQAIGIDYSKIKILAKQIPFGKHPLHKLDDKNVCRMYLEMLLTIIRLDMDEEITVNRLIFIQWLQMQTGIDVPISELIKDCYKTKTDSYYEFANAIPQRYIENFMVDAMIVANIGGSTNHEIYEYLVGLSIVLGINKEQLRIISLLARVALCQNLGQMKKTEMEQVQKYAKSYTFYIESAVFEWGIGVAREADMDLFEWGVGVGREAEIASNDNGHQNTKRTTKQIKNIEQRVIVIELKMHEVQKFKWKTNQKQKVQRDDVIATYIKPRKKSEDLLMVVQAPLTGTIFQFQYEDTIYGVIGNETDSKDSIKAWVESRR